MSNTHQQPQPYSVRLPPEMRQKLEDSARMVGRSLHAEILMRLGESLKEALGIAIQDSFTNLSPDMRIRLKANADTHGWTIGKEIAWRLEKSLEADREQEENEAIFEYEQLDLPDDEAYYPVLLENPCKKNLKKPRATEVKYENSLNNLVRTIAIEIVKEQFAKAGITIPDDNQ
ncbi:MAG: Arc family DNA-binding protein [Candidatus Thiothrix putei]|nr:MAG: Arc family DNA-binding protein [Candidatus Thiothrix putei]